MKMIRLLALFVLSAATAFAVPSVTTNPADPQFIRANSARVNCTLAMDGNSGDLSIEYGTTNLLGSETNKRRVGPNVTNSPPFGLGGLMASTQYFFRGKLTVGGVDYFGSTLTFTTSAPNTGGGGGATLTPRVVAVVGQPVPGAADSFYAKLGPPAVGAFAGKVKTGTRSFSAVFAANGSLAVVAPSEAPGLPDGTILKLGLPSGDAVRATLKPGDGSVLPANKEVILAGLATGPVRIAARTGIDLSNAAGVSIKSFGAIDGNGSVIFFQATLQGTNITSKNNAAICAALADGSVRLLVQKGQDVGDTKVKTIGYLVGAKGTLAEGRWRTAADRVAVSLTFEDRTQRFYIITSTANTPADWIPLPGLDAPAPVTLMDTTIKKIGLPGFGGFGPALVATFAAGTAGTSDVAKTNDTAVVRSIPGGTVLIAREGGVAPDTTGAPLTGLTFKSFGNPISGVNGGTVFTAVLNGARGAASNGIWRGDGTNPLRLIVRGGDDAPDAGKFASFSSLVFPDSLLSGPIFTAKLAASAADGITGKNNTGLYAVNTTGTLIGLLRTNDTVVGVAGENRIIKSFVALTPATGSVGAANGYDNAGKVAVFITFTDRTVALVEFTIP